MGSPESSPTPLPSTLFTAILVDFALITFSDDSKQQEHKDLEMDPHGERLAPVSGCVKGFSEGEDEECGLVP